jgi:hypothetical protein
VLIHILWQRRKSTKVAYPDALFASVDSSVSLLLPLRSCRLHAQYEGDWMVTSNLGFADWTQVFGDERLTAALLDRLTHRSHILEFAGESYRFRQRMKKQEQSKKG